MACLYREKCALHPDSWKTGRGVNKLQAIQESVTYDCLDHGRVNLMLKKEVNPVNFGDMKFPSKARGIQFCTNLRTAYELATQQTSFCHALAEATAIERSYAGIKCCVRYSAQMDPVAIGAFATESENRRASYACSFIDERDGKNWDANVQREHREALAEWYGQISKELREQALQQIKVRGRYTKGRVRVTYVVDGTVKSGHWDTSSGNGILNLEVTMQAMASLPAGLRPVEVRGLIMGDDLILWLFFGHKVCPLTYRDAINAAEQRLGIHPVRGIFGDLLNASFCSMGFYRTSDGSYVALPKVGRCLAKLFWTVTPRAGRDPARLASSIAHAFMPAYHGYRPMRLFLRHHMKVPPLEFSDSIGTFSYVLREFQLPLTNNVLWHECHAVKYGLPPDALDDMQELLDSCPVGVIDHPVVNAMIQQDMSDPPDRRGLLA